MEEIKTDRQLNIELRNKISARIVEAKANILYWKEVTKKSKRNSPEIVQALASIELNEANVEKDLVFLECVDKILKE